MTLIRAEAEEDGAANPSRVPSATILQHMDQVLLLAGWRPGAAFGFSLICEQMSHFSCGSCCLCFRLTFENVQSYLFVCDVKDVTQVVLCGD